MEESKLLDLMETAERLEAVAAALEDSAAKLAESHAATPLVEHIVATVASERELELERKLAEAEQRIATLAAAASEAHTPVAGRAGRKTLSAGTTTLLAKQGVSVEAGTEPGSTTLEASALDAALSTLSIEQRFAVKAELLRNGLLG